MTVVFAALMFYLILDSFARTEQNSELSWSNQCETPTWSLVYLTHTRQSVINCIIIGEDSSATWAHCDAVVRHRTNPRTEAMEPLPFPILDELMPAPSWATTDQREFAPQRGSQTYQRHLLYTINCSAGVISTSRRSNTVAME